MVRDGSAAKLSPLYGAEVSREVPRLVQDDPCFAAQRERFPHIASAVDARTIAAWARAVDCEEADAVVVGCSAFRAAESGFIDELEAELGKPVVTSTQAFMWSMLRMAGVRDRIGGYGALFSRC